MSTKKQTTNQYNAAGMGAYNTLIPQASSALGGEISNPTGNMFFQQQQQMQNLNNQGQGMAMNQATMQNLQQQGISPGSPLYQQMMNQNQRQQAATQGQGYNQLLLQAGNLRQSAINSSMSFNPLQTGQTQTTSGLGTWLPQVAGMALGVATGGASTLGQAALSQGLGTALQNPLGQQANFNQSPFTGAANYGSPGSDANTGYFNPNTPSPYQLQPSTPDYTNQQLNPWFS